jgi:hypothetical protein
MKELSQCQIKSHVIERFVVNTHMSFVSHINKIKRKGYIYYIEEKKMLISTYCVYT